MSQQVDKEMQKIQFGITKSKNTFARNMGVNDQNRNDALNIMLEDILQNTIQPLYDKNFQLSQRVIELEKESKKLKPIQQKPPQIETEISHKRIK